MFNIKARSRNCRETVPFLAYVIFFFIISGLGNYAINSCQREESPLVTAEKSDFEIRKS
jgi:hypothetical protein